MGNWMAQRLDLKRKVALLADRPRRSSHRVWILGVAAVLAFVLGVIGWVQVARDDPTLHLDWMAVAYRSAALFALDGSGSATVPWTLDVARFLAPLATGVAATSLAWSLFLSVGQERLRKAVCSSARGHVVLVGSVSQVAPYRGGQLKAAGQLTVHVNDKALEPVAGEIRMTVGWSAREWMRSAGLGSAAKIVLASGSDETNLRLLSGYLADVRDGTTGGSRRAESARRERPVSEPEVIVEIDERATALWLSIALALDRPDSDIEVVCRDDGIASTAANQVLSALGVPVPDEGTQRSPTSRSIVLGLVGDHAVQPLLARHLVEGLRSRYIQSDATATWRVCLVDNPRGEAIAQELRGTAGITVKVAAELDDLLRTEVEVITAVVAYGDHSSSVRAAVELTSRRLGSEAHVLCEDGLLPVSEQSRIRPIAIVEGQGDGAFQGPFTRAARERQDHCAARASAGTRIPRWNDLDHGDQRKAIGVVRRMVAALPGLGYTVEAAIETARFPAELSGEARVQLQKLDAAKLGSVDSLPSLLFKAGVRVSESS